MSCIRSTLLASLCVLSLACGGKNAAQSAQSAVDQAHAATRDAWALLPPKALALGTLDVKAMFRAGESGRALGLLVSRYMPIGPETGLSLEQNVDKLVCGLYAVDSDDVLCVALGRFDADRFDKAVAQLEQSAKQSERPDAQMKLEEHAGHKLYTIHGAGLVRLDDRHVLAGRARVVRGALDRLAAQPAPPREQSPSAIASIEAERADLVAVADLQDKQLGVLSAGPVRVRTLSGLREAKVLVHFSKQPPGAPERALSSRHDVSLLTWLRYDDRATAEERHSELERLLGMLQLAQKVGYAPKISESQTQVHDAKVPAGAAHVQIGLGFSDAAMAQWIEAAPSTFDLPQPPSRTPTGPVPGADPR